MFTMNCDNTYSFFLTKNSHLFGFTSVETLAHYFSNKIAF